MGGHPLITNKHVKLSHHKSEEVAFGTLKGISKDTWCWKQHERSYRGFFEKP